MADAKNEFLAALRLGPRQQNRPRLAGSNGKVGSARRADRERRSAASLPPRLHATGDPSLEGCGQAALGIVWTSNPEIRHSGIGISHRQNEFGCKAQNGGCHHPGLRVGSCPVKARWPVKRHVLLTNAVDVISLSR